MHFSVSDLIGTFGVALLLIAFLLNLLNRMSQTSLSYILLNCVGAALACLASVMINYFPFIILEGTWTVVSIVALVNYLRKKSN